MVGSPEGTAFRAGGVEGADEIEDDGIAAQFVGHEAAGEDQAVEVVGADAVQSGIGAAGVSVLAGVKGVGLRSGDGRRCTGFLEAQEGVPGFEVLVDVADDDEEMLVL